ncbi:Pyruvate/2-oxoglutarate dehydrogenase complex, dihydrolipoamide dehydrogenase (E3) component [Devosia sp. YR412]|uniref:FAD-dependent oxidoreductase n=1 Tax=Devosia sp. YR412 TaxID=1881030 RepID=UPI0008C75601|nr:FAD-dependent oxidoreductase [Devosia sp. YR412]SEP68211.1 Pyruvate/2-oxoglutarate dehydrogenase complex, dihydrolipoamide dehydrogenase (E3) component [Devosia sp. YR412]
MADLAKPDLCVIGAGALGTALAIKAHQAGLAVVLVPRPRDEANDPTAGSLRRAAFVASAERAQMLRAASELGLSNAEPKPNFRTIGERADAIAEAVAPRDTDERLTALGITVLSGEASFTDRQTMRCGETSIRPRQFALTTGSQPLVPALPGLDEVKFFTPDSIGDNLRKLSHLVVIGGTPLAFELAQAYRRLGSMVTLVPQGGLLPGFDPELVAILLRDLRAEGLVILDDAEVTAINKRSQGTGIALKRGEAEDSLDVSHILVAMGRTPDLDAALLDPTKLRRHRSHADRLLLGPDGQTSNPRITALGGAAGEDEVHVGLKQASLLIDRLSGRGHGRLDENTLPRLVQTRPMLAQLGPLDATLRPGQSVLRSNLAENETARAQGAAHGVAKLVVDAKGSIAAAGSIGQGAGETAGLLAMAMTAGLRLGDLANLALPQPSAAAALVDLAEQFAGQQAKAGWAQKIPLLGRR